MVVIGDAARERFPHLERITIYGSAKFLVKKSRDEWKRIGGAGITRIHSGLESGDPVTLEQICKGVDPEAAARAFNHVMEAGIELSVYLMVGVAGLERWREHAEGSAAVLNRASPDFVRLRTFVPVNVSAVINGTPTDATYYVLPDYLCIGRDDDFVRMPMTPLSEEQEAKLRASPRHRVV